MNRVESHPQDKAQAGSILLIVVLLVGMILIGATVVGVAMNRNLDRQRASATQTQLENAWNGLFGPPIRATSGTILRMRQGNMRSDFFLDPSPTSYFTPTFSGTPPDLKAMTTRTSVNEMDQTHAIPSAFTGALPGNTNKNINAWNGPYWAGSVDGSNRPVDAWGRPFQLRYISGVPGWQVYSLGGNGVDNTGNSGNPAGDDLAFPIPPAALPVFATTALSPVCASPITPFNRTPGFNPAENVTITLSWTVNGGGSTFIVVKFNNGNPGGTTATSFTNIPQALITVTLWSDKRGTLTPSPSSFTLTSSCSNSTINF